VYRTIPAGTKNIHTAINSLFMAFPQPFPHIPHGIPAVSGRPVSGADVPHGVHNRPR
jgi:hypothetical protein